MHNLHSATKALAPKWMFYVLLLAALYNLVWGAMVIIFPYLVFDLTQLPRPIYPEIWQCVGMIVGCYGIAYGIAAFDPVRFWPIVLVGLLGKILGPIGFIQAIYLGRFNLSFGWNIVFNDLIWWIPFFLILKYCFQEIQKASYFTESLEMDEVFQLKTSRAKTLGELSLEKGVFLIFLRHFGCSFCRETLKELNQFLQTSQKEIKICLVHQSSAERGEEFLSSYFAPELWSRIHHLSDPDCRVYRAFALPRSNWKQMINLSSVVRGFQAAILRRHGVGRLEGDGFQMGGALFLQNRQVTWRQKTAGVGDPLNFGELQKLDI
jgi:hypothetical protein